MSDEDHNAPGAFLKACRLRLDPASFGFVTGRRRTPGLRREEVAQLASISPTWYTWLEQGRGGAPSKEVLNRIASGLRLTAPERDHLFILAFGHPPENHFRGPDTVTPRLQRVLDAMTDSPAIIKTVTWDVIAWNRAAAAVLTDYGALPREQRNILRLMFSDSRARSIQTEWESVASVVVNAFRADVARAGRSRETERLIEELSLASPEFAALWRRNDVAGHAEGVKHLHHPQLEDIALEFSTFIVDGRPDLTMMVFNPADGESQQRIRQWLNTHPAA
ncbi:helix-turn-helix transcriptional regulator [Enterobacter soli]|uniref:helix-turn-helix transcriptional regulator n=1 Tax=Enterobacter soli TaxID=885040 RepID=UPI003ED8625E